MVFRYARHPHRLEAEHPRIIEDLLEFAHQGYQEAVNTMIAMLEDLYISSLESRFVKKLQGLPVWEHTSKSRGGLKGGSRIYFFLTSNNEAVLVNAEVKAGNKASLAKLEEVLDILEAYLDGKPVIERRSS